MPRKTEKQPITVVEIDNSDDEDGVAVVATNNKSSSSSSNLKTQSQPQSRPLPLQQQQHQQSSIATAPPVSAYQALECRSFWKAGACDAGLTARKAPAEGHTRHLLHFSCVFVWVFCIYLWGMCVLVDLQVNWSMQGFILSFYILMQLLINGLLEVFFLIFIFSNLKLANKKK